MDTTAERMTVEDYYAITVEGDRKQLVDGAIVVNEPHLNHMRVQRRLIVDLDAWVGAEPGRGEACLPIDVQVDEHNLYGPDVTWFAERERPNRSLPDLAVEIRSPSTWRYDRREKREAYERAGLRELWLVDDRAETVHVCRRSRMGAAGFDVELLLGIDDELTSPLLPGFTLPLARLFRDS
jgi:Uma2 family endonuclease